MIQALIFDMDGTLVQTELLKARSYAKAAVELCPRAITEGDVLEAYEEVVGRSRQDVATALMARFDLETAARSRMHEFSVDEPWQAFVQVRLAYYDAMIRDEALLRDHAYTHTLDLLDAAYAIGCKVALATTSTREATTLVLNALGYANAFAFTATADDVERTKPDPEVYHLVLKALGVEARNALAIEDSPVGIRAATRAGVACIAVTTDFTRERVYAAGLLPEDRIVDDPALLPIVVRRVFAETA